MSPADVGQTLGDFVDVRRYGRCRVAVYLFDRGVEEEPSALKTAMTPVAAMLDISTLGASSFMQRCVKVCQRGYLEALYSESGKLLGAKERSIPEYEMGDCCEVTNPNCCSVRGVAPSGLGERGM
jgi:hypothetical protein